MKKYICDHCGNEYSVNSCIDVQISPLTSVNPFGSIQGEVQNFSLDLCDDCLKDVKILLTEVKHR
jgi:hypothetical protein